MSIFLQIFVVFEVTQRVRLSSKMSFTGLLKNLIFYSEFKALHDGSLGNVSSSELETKKIILFNVVKTG